MCAKGPWSEWGPWEMRGEQMAILLWAVALGRFWEGRGLTTRGGLGPQGTTNNDITPSGAAWYLLRDCLWVRGWGPPPSALGPPATLFHVASQCPSPFPSACRECPVSKHLVGGGLTSRMWWSEGRGREGPCVLGWVARKHCGLRHCGDTPRSKAHSPEPPAAQPGPQLCLPFLFLEKPFSRSPQA